LPNFEIIKYYAWVENQTNLHIIIMTLWHLLNHKAQSVSGEISASIEIKPDSNWFSGHFPGDPILPGVAQLGMVFDAINHHCCQELKITKLKRVRFKQIIRPDECLKLFAQPVKGNSSSYSFKILVREKLACTGIMTVEER